MLAAVAAGMAAVAQAAEVNDVKARQRWPWNGLVDIDCTVSGIDATDYGLNFAVAAVMPDSSVHNATNFWVAKDGKKSFVWCVPTNGNYRLIWDARADATVTITQDGVAIAENLAGEGERAWCSTASATARRT